jgi:hypothetical protein
MRNSVVVCVLALFAAAAAACSTSRTAHDHPAVTVDGVASDLDGLSGPSVRAYHDTFRNVLDDAIDKDGFVCLPTPREVFFGDVPDGERMIRGTMPHYGFFFGPMQYLVERRAGKWKVSVDIQVEPPKNGQSLELPDCELAKEKGAAMQCSGAPYTAWLEDDVCNTSGVFVAKPTRPNVRALLTRWSREVEVYFNRDARAFGLPISYDFEFTLVGDAGGRSEPVRADMVLPLWSTCGRTPYFTALRSGWPIPVLAHEMGHVLGLLDEYENVAETLGFYLKYPSGLELSRMGESRREGSRILPLHHYLVLRRYFCPEPRQSDPYVHAVE